MAAVETFVVPSRYLISYLFQLTAAACRSSFHSKPLFERRGRKTVSGMPHLRLTRGKEPYSHRKNTHCWDQDMPTGYPWQIVWLCLACLLILLVLNRKLPTAFGLRRPHKSLGTVSHCLERSAWLPLQESAACRCWGTWLVVVNGKAASPNDNCACSIAAPLAILPLYTTLLFHTRLTARGLKVGEWFHLLKQ